MQAVPPMIFIIAIFWVREEEPLFGNQDQI
jgi:hypothetical protein